MEIHRKDKEKKMEILNKKINFLGDSITEGHGTSDKSKVFVSLIKEKYNLQSANNYGIGGTRFAKQQVPSVNARWDLDFCSRVEAMEPDADIVVVFGGTNDFGHGDAPLGKFEDRTADTFYGACHVLMESLIVKYPRSQIVFLTPIHRCTEDNLKSDGSCLATYVNVIKEVAKYYALPVLDLFAISGIQPRVPVIKELYCPDGLHPNDAGHELLAAKIAGFLLSL
jgi:lysophospholipase L1-like esterase